MWKLNKLQSIFLVLFLISTVIVLIMPLTQIFSNAMPGDVTTPENEPTTAPSNQNSTAFIGSAIASATSLIGFVMTTVIAWRKEKRESALANVQQKKLEAELEKSKLELEELKKKGQKKKKK